MTHACFFWRTALFSHIGFNQEFGVFYKTFCVVALLFPSFLSCCYLTIFFLAHFIKISSFWFAGIDLLGHFLVLNLPIFLFKFRSLPLSQCRHSPLSFLLFASPISIKPLLFSRELHFYHSQRLNEKRMQSAVDLTVCSLNIYYCLYKCLGYGYE